MAAPKGGAGTNRPISQVPDSVRRLAAQLAEVSAPKVPLFRRAAAHPAPELRLGVPSEGLAQAPQKTAP